MNPPIKPPQVELTRQRNKRAAAYARTGTLPPRVGLTLSEALVLGLLQQGVKTYFVVLGHGSTEVGEILRIYQQAGVVKVFPVHSEIEASHAASALRWKTNEKAAVVTSIGPGAIQAISASWSRPLTGLVSGICLVTKRPRMKAITCSKSPSMSKLSSFTWLELLVVHIPCTPPGHFPLHCSAAQQPWTTHTDPDHSFC